LTKKSFKYYFILKIPMSN